MTNYWMIKWNPDAKSSSDLQQDFAIYLRARPPYAPARILKNRCNKVEVLTSRLFAEVKCCDIVAAYQAGKGILHGFCIATGTEVRDGTRWVHLLPAYVLEKPIRLLRLKRENNSPLQSCEFLKPSLPRSLYKLSPHDAALIYTLCPDEAQVKVAAKVSECLVDNMSQTI